PAAPPLSARVDDHRLPDLGDCQELKTPPESIVELEALGVGVQIYQWDGAAWQFVAPEAVLYENSRRHAVVATHFAGPTWMGNDGSTVVGETLAKCTPDPSAIPWLLLGAKSTTGPGIFEDVTFIQRLNTTGGLAPDAPGEAVGQEARVPYTAEYVFYR